MNFSEMKDIVIPEGKAVSIACGGKILWQKQQKQKYKRELLYLEGTGTQYINIGVVFKNTDECYLEAAVLTTSGDKFSIAPSVWNNNSNRFAMAGRLSSVFCAAYGSSSTSYSKYTPETAIDSDKHIFTYKDKVFAIEDLGATYDATNIFWGGDTTELRLFYGYNNPTHCRIYAYKQTRDGKAIVNMIPVLDVNDVPCMYDKVSGKLFYNKGTGEFAYAELSGLPSIYQEVEYLESTGTQYIDTGFVPNQDTRVITEHFYTKQPQNRGFIYGAGVSATNKAFELYSWTNNWNSPYGNTNIVITPQISLFISGKINIDKNKNNVTITYSDGTSHTKSCEYVTFTAPRSMWLFAINRGNLSVDLRADCVQLCSCKIWDSDNLVRDFIPCYRKSDNKPGMFDLVTKTFFTNLGTGEFLYKEKEVA